MKRKEGARERRKKEEGSKREREGGKRREEKERGRKGEQMIPRWCQQLYCSVKPCSVITC